MRFFNAMLLSTIAFSLLAQSNGEDWLAEVIAKQKAVKQQMAQQGQLDRYRPERVQNDISKYLAEAQAIANDSSMTLEQKQDAANRFFGSTASTIDAVPQSYQTSSLPQTLSAVFVSFSMTDHEIRQAFIAADKAGAEVYFNGLHTSDESIMDTMNRIKAIMASSDATPRARFHPRAFTELDVKQVPMIFHAVKGNVAYATGLLNFDWLKRRMEGEVGVNDFGVQGPVKRVEERNIIHELQQRMQNLDMEQKKRDAVKNFWGKQQFVSIPDAKETKTFYINPTVKVSKDITNPNGDVLARAGQVLNPLTSAPAKSTYYLFDGMNSEHVDWAKEHIDFTYTSGTLMFMTSRIEQANGWKHLESLRKTFSSEIYLIPNELVQRFAVTGLPAIVSTDLKKGLLKIQQINLQEESKP